MAIRIRLGETLRRAEVLVSWIVSPYLNWHGSSPGMIADCKQTPAILSLIDSISQGAEIGGGKCVQPIQKELAAQRDNAQRSIPASVSPRRAYRHPLGVVYIRGTVHAYASYPVTSPLQRMILPTKQSQG